MRKKAAAALLTVIVMVAAFMLFNQRPEKPEPAGNDSFTTHSKDYVGASNDYETASGQLDYSDDSEVAAYPQDPNATATHAGFTRVPLNHKGDEFKGLRLKYEKGDLSNVKKSDVRTFLLDIGVNNTAKNPGPEDISMAAARIEKPNSREIIVEPGKAPDYNLTADDRVIIELTGVQNPGKGMHTVKIEINPGETEHIYEPLRSTLVIE